MNKKSKNSHSAKKQIETKTVVQEEKSMFSSRKHLLFLGFITFILFANTISNGYNMDDNLVTQNHPLTSRGLEAISEIFTSPYYSDAMGYAYGYRPIVHVSYAIEHAFFGEKPGVSHFFNVILYVLSVILFFKLLLKWVGEKNVLLATIIALFFAIHPIHSEVVASLKNRDEILAFLFVILAGLSLEKYFTKQHWMHLVWVFLYFSLAMLSKKSVYPMVLVLPVFAVFLRDLTWKKVLFGTIALVIPGALIASELEFSKVILFSFLPIIGVGIVYFLKIEIVKEDFSWKRLWLNEYLWSGLAIFLAFYSVYASNILYVPFALLFACCVFLLDKNKGLPVLSIVFLLIGFWFNIVELKQLVVLILFVQLLDSFFKKEKINYLNVIFLLLAFLSIMYTFLPGQIASIVALGIFAFLFLKRKIFAFIFALVVLGISLFVKLQIPYFAIMLLVFFGFHTWSKSTEKSLLIRFFPLLFTLILIFSPHFLENLTGAYKLRFAATDNAKEMVLTANPSSPNQSILKEGRELEYIENTLIKPHSTQETIATGFATLGEYFRFHIFPLELSYYYGFSKVKTENFSSFWVWISMLVHFGLVVLALVNLRKKPLLSLGILWYVISILLFSNWVELVAGMVGERLAFTASAGFSIFLVSILFWIRPNLFRQKWGIVEYCVVLIFLLFTGRTFTRNAQWESPLTLMSADIGHLSNSAQANNLYALNLMAYSLDEPSYSQEQRKEMQLKAISHFERATEIWPAFMNAHFDIGRAASIVGDTKKAIEGYKRAIALDSTYFDSYYNLLDLFEKEKEFDRYLDLATKLNEKEKSPFSISALARAFYLVGEKKKCQEVLQKGLDQFPSSTDLKNNLDLINKDLQIKNE